MKWFDTLVKVVDTTDHLLDKVRKKPRKRLEVIPEPIQVKDPFQVPDTPSPAAKSSAPEPPREPPLGDPAIAAQIYGKRTCEWTGRAIAFLQERGIDARFVNIAEPENSHYEIKLVAATKQYTLPYVYLQGEFIGGYDALVTRLKPHSS